MPVNSEVELPRYKEQTRHATQWTEAAPDVGRPKRPSIKKAIAARKKNAKALREKKAAEKAAKGPNLAEVTANMEKGEVEESDVDAITNDVLAELKAVIDRKSVV